MCILAAIKLLDPSATIISPNDNVYCHPKDFPYSQKYKDKILVIVDGLNIRNSPIYVKHTLNLVYTVNILKLGDKNIMATLNSNNS